MEIKIFQGRLVEKITLSVVQFHTTYFDIFKGLARGEEKMSWSI